jgi:hypothetical protein
MDRDVVRKVAKGFDNHSQTLKKLMKQNEQVITKLKLVGLVAPAVATALAALLTVLNKLMTVLYMRCDEFSNDLQRACDDHERGDVTGKSYFGEGFKR